MMVQCQHHGYSAGVEASPDVASAIAAGERLSAFRELVYNYDGDPCMRIVLSVSFATEHDIGEGEKRELPDQYPAWHQVLSVVCEKCLDQAIECRTIGGLSGSDQRK